MATGTVDIALDVLAVYDPGQARKLEALWAYRLEMSPDRIQLVKERLADALFVAGEDGLAEEVLS